MIHKVEFLPSSYVFNVDEKQDLLAAALSENISVPYSCKRGTCCSCKALLLKGDVSKLEGVSHLAEKEILLCQARALSDLTIEVEELAELKDIEVRTLPCRVHKIEQVASDVIVLELRLPPKVKFRFLPGQYIDLLHKEGVRRSYSIAGFDDVNNLIELHIRKVVGGVFTQHVFDKLKESDLLRFEGPFGSFFVRDKSTLPLIFLAGGTGFAPVQAMVKSLLRKGESRDIHVYWGGARQDGFYSRQPEQWKEKSSNVNYVPVLSGSSWEGRTGYVHHAVLDDFPSLSQYEVFACGSLEMVNSAREAFVMQGLPESAFFSDVFV